MRLISYRSGRRGEIVIVSHSYHRVGLTVIKLSTPRPAAAPRTQSMWTFQSFRLPSFQNSRAEKNDYKWCRCALECTFPARVCAELAVFLTLLVKCSVPVSSPLASLFTEPLATIGDIEHSADGAWWALQEGHLTRSVCVCPCVSFCSEYLREKCSCLNYPSPRGWLSFWRLASFPSLSVGLPATCFPPSSSHVLVSDVAVSNKVFCPAAREIF